MAFNLLLNRWLSKWYLVPESVALQWYLVPESVCGPQVAFNRSYGLDLTMKYTPILVPESVCAPHMVFSP